MEKCILSCGCYIEVVFLWLLYCGRFQNDPTLAGMFFLGFGYHIGDKRNAINEKQILCRGVLKTH
jgi:hypothetical protein